MSVGEIAILSSIIFCFALFASVLGWVSRSDPKTSQARRHHTPASDSSAEFQTAHGHRAAIR